MPSGQQALNWTSEQDEILIDFVKTHEGLYNVQSKDYRKTQLKQNLWRQIGEILHKTDIDCSKRWSYVRDYYIRRRGKPGTGSPGEAAKKRQEQLSFLDSLCSTKRSTITNIDNSEPVDINTEETGITEETLNEESSRMEESQLSTRNETDVAVISEAEVATVESLVVTPSLKRKHLPSKSKNSEERMKLLKQIVERQKDQSPQVLDETDLFFASMAKIVKKLPERARAELRLQIGTLVGNVEIQHLSNTTVDHRPSPTPSSASSNTFEDYLSDDLFSPQAPCASPVTPINKPIGSANITNLF